MTVTTTDSNTSFSLSKLLKNEKEHAAHHVDEAQVPAGLKAALDYDEEYSAKEQRQIIHMVDRRLLSPTVSWIVFPSMDQTNLSAAVIASMLTDL
jgi:hypothetical protein